MGLQARDIIQSEEMDGLLNWSMCGPHVHEPTTVVDYTPMPIYQI
jgi:hypothetical protein